STVRRSARATTSSEGVRPVIACCARSAPPRPPDAVGRGERFRARSLRVPAGWLVGVALLLASVAPAAERCRCRHARVPRCADATAQHRATITIDFTVVDGTIELLTQSGPYRVPVDYLDGKSVLVAFMPRGEVF